MQQSASAATALITTKPLNGSKQRAETKRNETKEEEEIWRERHRPSFAVV